MRRRRGNGEGSIYQLPSGRWRCFLTVGYDENGKRRRRYLYGRTKGEVLEKLTETRGQAAAGMIAQPDRVTVAEFARSWLDTVGQAGADFPAEAPVIRSLLHVANTRITLSTPDRFWTSAGRSRARAGQPQRLVGVLATRATNTKRPA